ncbi:MAG: hypothetical protein F6K45_12870 [Kamptonema sp. SIO1D9]|nr:hypothetical protein [Kamptonema sp. SIO1D9]
MAAKEQLPSVEELKHSVASINFLADYLFGEVDSPIKQQFKANALAQQHPETTAIVKLATDLIAQSQPLPPEELLTVTQLASKLSEILSKKISAKQVNSALIELGFQETHPNQSRSWQLTETGTEYGLVLATTSKTNSWSGTRVKWFEKVISPLTEYFSDHTDVPSSATNGRNSRKPIGGAPQLLS